MGVVVCVDGIPLVYPVNIENTCGGMNTEYTVDVAGAAAVEGGGGKNMKT